MPQRVRKKNLPVHAPGSTKRRPSYLVKKPSWKQHMKTPKKKFSAMTPKEQEAHHMAGQRSLWSKPHPKTGKRTFGGI